MMLKFVSETNVSFRYCLKTESVVNSKTMFSPVSSGVNVIPAIPPVLLSQFQLPIISFASGESSTHEKLISNKRHAAIKYLYIVFCLYLDAVQDAGVAYVAGLF